MNTLDITFCSNSTSLTLVDSFYPGGASYARVLTVVMCLCLFVCVCLSVTHQYCITTAKRCFSYCFLSISVIIILLDIIGGQL